MYVITQQECMNDERMWLYFPSSVFCFMLFHDGNNVNTELKNVKVSN